MEEDFTPRFSFSLVGAEGQLHREVRTKIKYHIDTGDSLTSTITLFPSTSAILSEPTRSTCQLTNKSVPELALSQCVVSKSHVLTHLLTRSEHSGRRALPEHTTICEQSKLRLISDEATQSAITGRLIAKHVMTVSEVSRKYAEKEHFGICAFTGVEALKTEFCVSDISGKFFRADASLKSSVSPRVGHRSEFIACHQTRDYIAIDEAESCSVTGKQARPGILQTCEETGFRALPSEIGVCAISNRKALKNHFLRSSVSQLSVLPKEAVRSISGLYCTPLEAKKCFWSGRLSHPEDLRRCGLSELTINSEYSTANASKLDILKNLLDGTLRNSDCREIWDQITAQIQQIEKGRCRVAAAILSPTKQHIALCIELKTMMGLRTRHVGLIFSKESSLIVGRIAVGARDGGRWSSKQL